MNELEVRYLHNIKGDIIGVVRSDGSKEIYNDSTKCDYELLGKTEELKKAKHCAQI